MSTGARIPLAHAIAHAEAFRALFDGTWREWVIAGSIRRRRQEIGDIEHAVLPIVAEPERDLLGQIAKPATTLVRRRIDELLASGTVTLHRYGEKQTPRNGELYIGLDYRGRQHEIFMGRAENFGCVLSIRTGSAEFSKGLVTRLLRRGYRQMDGCLNRVGERGRLEVVPCPDEATMFAAAGLTLARWPPERRECCP